MSAQPKSLHFTAAGDPRGYIEPHALRELWFHTGTACNLACPFCLEGSKPGDSRLGRITLAEAQAVHRRSRRARRRAVLVHGR